jgi:hypothetical protein
MHLGEYSIGVGNWLVFTIKSLTVYGRYAILIIDQEVKQVSKQGVSNHGSYI